MLGESEGKVKGEKEGELIGKLLGELEGPLEGFLEGGEVKEVGAVVISKVLETIQLLIDRLSFLPPKE